MRAKLRIGDVFPSKDRVSQFLAGLCMSMNDLTLVFQQMDRLSDTQKAKSRENTYYLYLTCAYFREAAKFLDVGLAEPAVADFLKRLSEDGKANLQKVRESFSPWTDSLVSRNLKPIRDVVFHYEPWSPDKIEPHLSSAADDNSSIEMGEGRYVDNRYEFADAVFEEFVLGAWGGSETELTAVIERVVELTLAFTYFVHEAVALRINEVGLDKFEIER